MSAEAPRPDPLSREVGVTRVGPADRSTASDRVAVEEPLEIRVAGSTLLVTMRTPGHDLDLVRGLLFSDGFVERGADIVAIAHCDDVPADARGNVVNVELARGIEIDPARARAALVTAACGVCGAAAIETLMRPAPIAAGPTVERAVIGALPQRMREHQAAFATTGGLHAAALFDEHGKLLTLREDVGRHNAVDKVIGDALRFDLLPLSRSILMVSGRAGFEIAQKARRAGAPILCAVSAPSSLAIEVATAGTQTLIGFLRNDRFNIYTGDSRIL